MLFIVSYYDKHAHVRRKIRLMLHAVDLVTCAIEVGNLLKEEEYSNWEWWQVRNSNGIAVLWDSRN